MKYWCDLVFIIKVNFKNSSQNFVEVIFVILNYFIKSKSLISLSKISRTIYYIKTEVIFIFNSVRK